jgi:signal transduction histidine kinase
VLRRLPIRLRLTLAFTAVMAVVLAATGLFLYLRLGSDLDRALDQGLRARAAAVGALVAQSDTGLRDAARSPGAQGADFAQIVDASGRVFDATAGLERRPVLDAARLRLAARRATTVARATAPPLREPSRLLATPVRAQGRHLVVIVGASLEGRDDALANLGTLLLIGGPVALLLAALAAYGVATAALRPVESMRARAAAISADDLDQRLPLSASRDELRRLGATLNQMLARLEAGVARERGFVADASHELRTPLAMLRTELELVARDRPIGTALDDAVASAIAETDRLARLTEDLLVLARADRSRLPVRHATVAVDELLAGVAARYSDADVEAAAPTGMAVRGDPDRLEQALTNLVDNALRHGAEPVRLAAVAGDGLVELHVTDGGPGFPPGFLASAFDRFTRGDPGRTEDGSGLGLAIAQAIAASHDGRAGAANRSGGGADVWVAVPAAGKVWGRDPGALAGRAG